MHIKFVILLISSNTCISCREKVMVEPGTAISVSARSLMNTKVCTFHEL